MSQTLAQKLLPTAYEIWCVALVAAALLVIGNSQTVLDRFGLLNSSNVVHQNFTGALQNGLSTLDAFSFTPSLVTFMVWAAIGLIVFSILQAFARASGVIEFERDIGSNRYVHPANFSRSQYWARVITDSILSFLAFAGLIIYGFFYVLFILPVGLTYTNLVVREFSADAFIELFLGIFTVFVGTFLLYMCIEIIVWRHRISRS